MQLTRSRLGLSLLLGVALAACTEPLSAPIARAPVHAPRLAVGGAGSITDLGTLGGAESEAYGINNAGQVVGWAKTTADETHAFRYTPGSGMEDLGTLGGTTSIARGINDLGDVVGVSENALGEFRAFLYTTAGGMVDLGTLGGMESDAYSINDAGQIVGWAEVSPGASHAFLYTTATGMQDLGSANGGFTGSFFGAWSINASGQLVGTGYESTGFDQHGFLYTPGAGPALDLGTLGGPMSEALGINDAGQAVGYSVTADGNLHVFLHSPGGVLQDIGTLGTLGPLGGAAGVGLSINDASPVKVTGVSVSAGGYFRAFRYTAGLGMGDLGTLPGGLESGAGGINDVGQVAGYSDGNGPCGCDIHAVVWDENAPVNYVPTADVGGPYTADEGTSVTFDGSGSSDPEGAALTYEWDFGDGSPPEFGATVTHVYTDDGDYDVTLAVSDGTLLAVAMAPVTIGDVSPNATAGPDQLLPLGQSTFIAPNFTDGSADGPWNYVIDWGDGTVPRTGTISTPGAQPTILHNYTALGVYTVTLTVTDQAGTAISDAADITIVTNTAPTANVNGPYVGTEGTPVCFSSAGSADAEGEPLKFAWETGDGGVPVGASPCRTYKDNGVYTLKLTVRDALGLLGTATTQVTIANVAPTASFAAPTQVTEGEAHTISLNGGTDAGAFDRPTLEYRFDCGQGAGPTPWSTSVRSIGCPALPDQRSPVGLTGEIRDKDGAVTTYTKAMGVANALPVPTLVATTPTTFQAGGTLGVQGSFSDLGLIDGPWTYTIVWGKGLPATTGTVLTQVLPPASRVYATPGTYNVSLSVQDKDGKPVMSNRITVTVTP